MLVGKQPGDQEDLRGQPCAGPAGKLLDRALTQLGWPRETLFIANAVKHFKYETRGTRRMRKTPAQREVEVCVHWLERDDGLRVLITLHPSALLRMDRSELETAFAAWMDDLGKASE